ncbi:hypothetical protein ACX3P1_28330, partial [Mesorhizobium sp. A623]
KSRPHDATNQSPDSPIGWRKHGSQVTWHAAGVANGGTSIENPPGIREMGSRKLYLAYLRDPTGNKLCARAIVTD